MPYFSVIVPTCDRPESLRRSLSALAAQAYSTERFEILVADDGGTVAIDDALAACRQRGVKTTLHRQPNAGPAAARNAAARLAQGEILAFTDDDCTPAPDWLAQLERRHLDTPGRMVGGRTVNLLRDNRYSATSQLIVDLVYDHFNADPERATFFSSNNLTVPRVPFLEMGGFDARLRISEDRELCDRWLHGGYRMTYVPEAVVYHAHPMTLTGFVRRHFGRGRGAVAYHRIRSVRGSGRLRDDFSFHRDLRNFIAYPFRKSPAREAIPLAALLLTWQVANTAGFAWEAARSILPPRRSIAS